MNRSGLVMATMLILTGCSSTFAPPGATTTSRWGPRAGDIGRLDRDRVLEAARAYLTEKPVTVTAATSTRSAGGKHDFFSEGDYWWPSTTQPDGPYVLRDGADLSRAGCSRAVCDRAGAGRGTAPREGAEGIWIATTEAAAG